MTPIVDLDEFTALDPFFSIIERGLEGLVWPGHFFDLLGEDIEVEYVITVPGYPRHVNGREAVADLYRPYGKAITLQKSSGLAVHHDLVTGVVVLEYTCEGRVVATGDPYVNHYISVLTIKDGLVVNWRDYLDPLAVFNALGWPSN